MNNFTLDDINILFEDKHYIAVDKPSGLLIHRAPRCSDKIALLQLVRDKINSKIYPIHRLDRGTSGIVVFGKTSEAAAALSKMFTEKSVSKRYLVVVRGFTQRSGVIDYPLVKDDIKGAVEQEAMTRYFRLSTYEIPGPVGKYETARYSLVLVKPETGRMHQIRRHFAHIRHPVVVDSMHGDGAHNKFIRERFNIERLLLAAVGIRFHHPFLNESVNIKIDMPLEMKRFIDESKST
jgi:tRNA pseudouridine65 synthase